MYNELYAAWRREVDESDLGGLPPDFYAKIAEYLKRIREENKKLDSKPPKINLVSHEAKNVLQMLDELLANRYQKMLQTIMRDQKIPKELLTTEEERMCANFAAFASNYHKFTSDLLEGQAIQAVQQPALETGMPTTHKRSTLRFIKNIPAIMGADLKSYGPFVVEDVASLPIENARMLVKQGLAVMVEIS